MGSYDSRCALQVSELGWLSPILAVYSSPAWNKPVSRPSSALLPADRSKMHICMCEEEVFSTRAFRTRSWWRPTWSLKICFLCLQKKDREEAILRRPAPAASAAPSGGGGGGGGYQPPTRRTGGYAPPSARAREEAPPARSGEVSSCCLKMKLNRMQCNHCKHRNPLEDFSHAPLRPASAAAAGTLLPPDAAAPASSKSLKEQEPEGTASCLPNLLLHPSSSKHRPCCRGPPLPRPT